ncbi:MAG: HAD family hydrolase [Halodesulfurarchaeum sp.]
MDEDTAWEAVFWDIGGVILSLESVQRGHAAFVEALCERYPCAGDPETAIDRWRRAVGDYFSERDEMTFRPAREAYDRANEEILEAEIDRSEWRPLFHDVVDRYIETNEESVETVRALAETDLHVGVISDVDTEEGRRILRTFDLYDSFDSFTTSEEVDKTKPHPAMFEAALEKAGVDPRRSLMIGDRYRNDMEGAKDVGLATVGYGTEDGDAVDYRIENLSALLDIVDESATTTPSSSR